MSWPREWQAEQQAERCYRGWHSDCSVRCTITDHAWCDSGAVMAWGVFLPLSCNCAKFFLTRDYCMFCSCKAQTVTRKRLSRFNVLFSESFPSSLPNVQAYDTFKEQNVQFFIFIFISFITSPFLPSWNNELLWNTPFAHCKDLSLKLY